VAWDRLALGYLSELLTIKAACIEKYQLTLNLGIHLFGDLLLDFFVESIMLTEFLEKYII
jgi:hypothetical protein